MGRYSSYGIATSYVIPYEDLVKAINKKPLLKSGSDFDLQMLRTQYPEEVYDITRNADCIVISLKERYNGTDIYSLLKDFSAITPYPSQLSLDELQEIGAIIKDQPISVVLELADRNRHEGFQKFSLPYYLYRTPVQIEDVTIYPRAEVNGILIGISYTKMVVEDDTEPFRFLTTLLRYRLQSNPLAPTLLAFLSV